MLFISNQSKLIALFGFISIVISVINKFNIQKILGQLIVYFLIARNADCLVYGNCRTESWLSISIPLIGIFIFLLDNLGVFDRLKKNLKNIKNKINKVNNLKLKY